MKFCLVCLPYILLYNFNDVVETVPYKTYFDYVVNKRPRCDEYDSCSCLFPPCHGPRSTHWLASRPEARALHDMVLHMFIISYIYPTPFASLCFPSPPAKS